MRLKLANSADLESFEFCNRGLITSCLKSDIPTIETFHPLPNISREMIDRINVPQNWTSCSIFYLPGHSLSMIELELLVDLLERYRCKELWIERMTRAIRPPKQDRSRKTLEKLMDATEQILSKKSVEELTTREILRVSGISNSSFYARIPGKDALLSVIWDELVRSIDGDIVHRYEELVDQPLEEKVRFLVEWRVSRYRKYGGLLRSFRGLTCNGKFPGSPKYRKKHQESRDRIVAFLMESKDEIGCSDKKHAIMVAEFVTTTAARELVLFPNGLHASTMKLSRSEMVDELTRVFLGCLRSGE